MVTATQTTPQTAALPAPRADTPDTLVQTVIYIVTPQDSVRTIPLSREFAHQPAVMASARLLAVCEWPCMDRLREMIAPHECSLGTSQRLDHLAPIRIGAQLVVTAHAITVHERRSCWRVEAHEQHTGILVARADLSFAVVDLDAFERRLHTEPVAASA